MFLNPATGVLAGWKSADGQLQDYWFTLVQGVAITCGLLDDKTTNTAMDSLLAKMQAVGYTNFSLGLPGNLVLVKKGDYADQDTPPPVYGVPRLDDGSDVFNIMRTAARPPAGLITRSRRSTNWAAWQTRGASSTRCWRAMRRANFRGSTRMAGHATGAIGAVAATAMRACSWPTIRRCWRCGMM